MHSIRRSVFRAVTTSSSVLKSRSIAAPSQFVSRVNRPAAVLSVFNLRRWSSDQAYDSAETSDFSNSREEGNSLGNHGSASAIEKSATIYVGNFPFETTQEALEEEFAGLGTIKSCKIITDARGLNKGFGYIEFETPEQAAIAIKAKDAVVFDGRRLVVNYQISKTASAKNSEPSKTLFVGNLAFEMSDADLNKLFRDIRNVVDVRVAIDRRTGQPRGFAHADFVDVESATEAMETLQGKEVYGRLLRIDYSASQKQRGDDRGRAGGGRGGDREGGRGGYGGDRGRDRGEDRDGNGGDRGEDRY